MALLEPIDELDQLQEQSAGAIAAGILRLAQTTLEGIDNRPAARSLDKLILDSMHYADLLGRRRVLLEESAAKAVNRGALLGFNIEEFGVKYEVTYRWHGQYAIGGLRGYRPQYRRRGTDGGIVIRQSNTELVDAAFGAEGPNFVELINNLLERVPRLAATADEVAFIYSTENAFAAVFSPSITVTENVQKAIARLARDGVSTPKSVEVLASMTDWSRAYASTVFRTNINTAYAAGRFKQVSDPTIAEVVPAFRYTAVGDVDTRPNHEAADGLIAPINDPVWDRLTPPLGYNCRCTLELVSRFEMERLGLINANGTAQRREPSNFASAGPDSERFGRGRPDRKLYGF